MRPGVTVPRLFGGMDVLLILNCNRALRAWDRTSAPAQSREDFVIEAGYLLWVEAPRGQTVGGSIRVSLPFCVRLGGRAIVLSFRRIRFGRWSRLAVRPKR